MVEHEQDNVEWGFRRVRARARGRVAPIRHAQPAARRHVAGEPQGQETTTPVTFAPATLPEGLVTAQVWLGLPG